MGSVIEFSPRGSAGDARKARIETRAVAHMENHKPTAREAGGCIVLDPGFLKIGYKHLRTRIDRLAPGSDCKYKIFAKNNDEKWEITANTRGVTITRNREKARGSDIFHTSQVLVISEVGLETEVDEDALLFYKKSNRFRGRGNLRTTKDRMRVFAEFKRLCESFDKFLTNPGKEKPRLSIELPES